MTSTSHNPPSPTSEPLIDDAKLNDQKSGSERFSGGAVKIASILGAHAAVDAYAMAFPASLVLFESRCGMSPVESAWLLGVGPLCSGLSQPVFAWVSDRYDSRLFTGLGLAICAICMCLIGFAQNSFQLLCFYVPAMIAAGSFHPVSAACVGHLSGSRRSLAASGFFVAGMIGGSLGSLVGPRFLSKPFGFPALPYLMIPGVLLAIAVHTKVASIPHRSRHARKQVTDAGDGRLRWTMVWLLFTANALRFTVNMALVYLAARWMENNVAATHADWAKEKVANVAAPQVGTLVACMIAGMGLGGVLSGLLIRSGREKLPLIVIPMLFAPAIWLLPSLLAPWRYLAALGAGIGFASMVPVGLAVGQRLLPHRTSLASGLMLGGAWSISLLGPRLAQFGLAHWGLPRTFQATAVVLAVSGLITIPLKSSLICGTALHEKSLHS